MIFTIYFTLSWFVIVYLLSDHSKITFKSEAFLFLISCLVHTHMYTLIPLNFKGFELSKNVEHYLVFLQFRTLIVPGILVLLFRLSCKKQKNHSKKFFFISLLFAFIIALLDFTGQLFEIYSYKWWNFGYSFLYYWLLFTLSHMLLKVFLKTEEVVT